MAKRSGVHVSTNSEWPISQVVETQLPDRIGITMTCESGEEGLCVINIGQCGDYMKLLRVTSRIINVKKNEIL